jgi:branched-subunit amino acid transport protein
MPTTTSDYLLLLAGMGLVTYIPRFVPLVFLARRSLPPVVAEWLDLIPAAILSALLAPALLTGGTPLSFTLWKPEFWAAVPTFLFALWTRSLGGTVVVGMVLYILADRLI